MKIRLQVMRALLGLSLLLLLIPWPLQIGRAQWISSDLSSIIVLIVIVAGLVKQPIVRMHGSTLVFFGIFFLWQMWMTVAWFLHPYDKSGPELIWHIFKNVWVAIPFPMLGYLVARSSSATKLFFLKTVLVVSGIAAATGIIQTVSGGKLLSGLITNQRFLGVFTPLPSDLYAIYIRDVESARATGGDAYYVGTVFRAHGPFLHTNPYTAAMAALSSFAFGPVVAHVTRRDKTTYGRTFRVVALGLLCSLGLAGYAALLVTVIYGLLVGQRSLHLPTVHRRLLIAMVLIPVACLGLLIAQPTVNPHSPLYQRFYRLIRPDKSAGFNGRFAAWSVITERVSDEPLFGARRPVTLADAGWADTDTPLGGHNSYLAVALYSGIPGMILFITLLLLVLRSSWLIFRLGPDVQTRALGLACHLLFVSLGIVGIAYDWIFMASVAGLFWLSGGLCMTLAPQLKQAAARATLERASISLAQKVVE